MAKGISMLSRTIGALFILGSLAPAFPGLAQSTAPCRAVEPAPRGTESNPTTRHAVVTEGSGAARTVTAETCLVVGTGQDIHPGGNYGFQPNGLDFNWNLAIVGARGRIVDVAGTVSSTGAIQPGASATLAIPLALGWNLAANEPNPLTNRLLTQVTVWPCTAAPPGCSHDGAKEVELTRLLRSPDRSNNSPAPESVNEPTGCLAPIKHGGSDPDLRQVTVSGVSGSYIIFTCLVSNKYKSFQSAGFTAVPLDTSGNPAAHLDGNTRQNIGPLFGRRCSRTPRLITLLAVGESPLAQTTPPIEKANITYFYTGCHKKDETQCDPQVQVGTVSGGVQVNPVTFAVLFYQK